MRGGSLLSIAIDEQYRGTGLSVKLVQVFEERLTVKGATYYTLSVYKNNLGARRFYEKCGMQTISESETTCRYQKFLT